MLLVCDRSEENIAQYKEVLLNYPFDNEISSKPLEALLQLFQYENNLTLGGLDRETREKLEQAR